MRPVLRERELPPATPEHALIAQVRWAGDHGAGEVAPRHAREGGVGEVARGVGGVGGVDERGVDLEKEGSGAGGGDREIDNVEAGFREGVF